MEITQKTITETKSCERINRKSISEIVNIYNPVQTNKGYRNTQVQWLETEGRGMYVTVRTQPTQRFAALTKQAHKMWLT
jgi:hypothetical protein